MKNFKSFIALVLVFLLVFSFAGCHTKNEVAVKIGDVEFTSAMYSMALLNADSEARTLVDESLEDGTTLSSDEDYYSQQVEGVDFTEWVEKTALEELSKLASYYVLCKENGIELEEDVVKNTESYADYYYSYYEELLTSNGIGKETYKKMQLYYAYSDAYFEFLYGEGGSKEIPDADMKEVYDDSYRTVFILYKDLSSLEDDAKQEAKDELNAYKARLDKGESIVDIYNEYYELTGDNAKSEEKDVISLIADPEVDSNYGFEDFASVKALSDGKTVAIDESEDGHDHTTSYYYVIKCVNTDSETSYFENMKDTIRWNLKQEEYNEDIAAYASELKTTVNKHAIKQFKVKDITY